MVKKMLVWGAFLLATFGSETALAAEPGSHTQEDYELRLEFIENRLEDNHRHARYWQNGWSAFYAVSAVAQTALWIDADDNDDSINYSIGALKSVGGLADMLLRPHPGRYGTERLLSLPDGTAEQRKGRLDFGETVMRDSATRAASCRSWQPHIKVIGVNVIAGALIAAFGDEGDALASTALGIAIGEANIWSQPIRPEKDWRKYQQTFPSTESTRGASWELVPIAGGLALQGRF